MPKLTKQFLTFANKLFDEVYRNYEHPEIGVTYYEDLVRNAARKLKRKIKNSSSGGFRTAFIFRDGVIKVARRVPGSAPVRLIEESDYIRNMRRNRKIVKHFPDTHVIQRMKQIDDREVNVVIQVQERVENIENWHLCNKWGIYVYELGNHLGIGDVHSANYGWAGARGREYPVFVDVDFRSRAVRRGKRPAWAP